MLKTYLKNVSIFCVFAFVTPTSFAIATDSTIVPSISNAKPNLPFEIDSGKITPAPSMSSYAGAGFPQSFTTAKQCPVGFVPYVSFKLGQLSEQSNQIITNVAACVYLIQDGMWYGSPGTYYVGYYAITKSTATVTAQICATSSKTLYGSSSSSSFDSRHIAYSNQCGGSTYVNVGGTDVNGNQQTGQMITTQTSISNTGLNEIMWHLICYPNTNPSININLSGGSYPPYITYTFPDCQTTGSSFT